MDHFEQQKQGWWQSLESIQDRFWKVGTREDQTAD
jgi:hypothetical protein